MTGDKIKKLQIVQNWAARLVVKALKSFHITPILKDLHWLPVYLRIDFEIAVFCFKSLNGLANLKDLLILVVPLTCLKTYGDRAFLSSGPRIWNALPIDTRNTTSISLFKPKLKTSNFRHYFDWMYPVYPLCFFYCMPYNVNVCLNV